MSNGSFSGNPKTEWLSDGANPDRDMKLLEDFTYTDPDGKAWKAPKGAVINGASIPQPLWSIVGSPYTADYRCASIVHDVACDDPTIPRAKADRMFYFACLAGGCTRSQARILYLGVRIGAMTSGSTALSAFAASVLAATTGAPATADPVLTKFALLKSLLDAMPVNAPFDAIEKLVNPALGLPNS